MTTKYPRHDIHVFDITLFERTGATCFLCWEEDQEQERKEKEIQDLLKKKDIARLIRLLRKDTA